jgi:hypothetical protein
MQSTLALLAGGVGLLAAWQTKDWRWSVGAVLILANWPYTLFIINPTNKRLGAIPDTEASGTSRALIVAWGKLHGVRTGLGIAAALAYVWASH